MKKILAFGLSLFLALNMVTIQPAHAIDWDKAKKHSITALKVSTGIAALSVIAYCSYNFYTYKRKMWADTRKITDLCKILEILGKASIKDSFRQFEAANPDAARVAIPEGW